MSGLCLFLGEVGSYGPCDTCYILVPVVCKAIDYALSFSGTAACTFASPVRWPPPTTLRQSADDLPAMGGRALSLRLLE